MFRGLSWVDLVQDAKANPSFAYDGQFSTLALEKSKNRRYNELIF